ncbi:MAG: endopeptidase La [Spirochaetales bacterium]|nr:endopeptidase La [Spirochaetales bacterium]
MSIIGINRKNEFIEIPLLISRDFVVFPTMRFPYFTSNIEISKIIKLAFKRDRMLFFAYPQHENTEKAVRNNGIEIFRIGTVVRIIQLTETQTGAVRFTGEALNRAAIIKTNISHDIDIVKVSPIEENREIERDTGLLMGTVRKSFQNLQGFQKKMPRDITQKINRAEYPDKLIDIIASTLNVNTDIKVELVQIVNREDRLRHLSVLLETEVAMMKLQGDIQRRVKERVEQAQKEYFLNEQIRQINKELGKNPDIADEADEIFRQIKDKNPPEEVLKKARREADRLQKLQPMAPESGVIRTYLEWLADIPWSASTDDRFDIPRAKKILDEDHYNMIKAKERILDYIAVRWIRGDLKGPILCLVGPPGTGKTSLGRSVARTLNREFIRMSLGGIRDEAEIRGHRKTYIGSLPGRIIQSMKKAGTINPVFLLDEIDKLGSDFRGDPSSALLEVLDPEQNSTFSDHYLEIPYNLSQVLFIATANSLHTIPAALRDRMEIIEIPGYSDIEKLQIAEKFLIPKQLLENGLESSNILFQKNAIIKLIREYTRESGVRNLERVIGSVLRKLARNFLSQKNLSQHPTKEDIAGFKKTVTAKSLPKLIGKTLFSTDTISMNKLPGTANGLAWTELGGQLLTVEAALMPGEGKLILTGNLGDVMKESARISLSYLQANSSVLNIPAGILKKHDIHVHVPQGAIPKDGPSAGITLTHAILSALLNKPILENTSMTGEITLTGRILAIGGVKEKVLASYRNGITTILLPAENQKDADEDIPKEVLEKITIHYVSDIQEALSITLLTANNDQKDN